MTDQEPYWHAEVHRIMPDLEIKTMDVHHEGLVNDILIVNKEWVFRFTKTNYGRELLDQEYQLLQFLQPKLRLSVPFPVIHGNGFMVYHHLEGLAFRREIWQQCDIKKQKFIGSQLGQFLHELHDAPVRDLEWEIPLTLAPVTKETWFDIYENIVQKVYPLLLPHQIDWVEELFEPALTLSDFFDFKPVLVHGDLAPYHILYSPEEIRLTAVIDFGVAGMGDPATDLGSLINSYGESLIQKIGVEYDEYSALVPRARFYAQAIELQWVLLGVESGEQYWFTAHLGGARDIGVL
ncbi:MAG: phosphotransferase family protein [Anaerolineales bacterium]